MREEKLSKRKILKSPQEKSWENNRVTSFPFSSFLSKAKRGFFLAHLSEGVYETCAQNRAVSAASPNLPSLGFLRELLICGK
jgi:hypothetical protein